MTNTACHSLISLRTLHSYEICLARKGVQHIYGDRSGQDEQDTKFANKAATRAALQQTSLHAMRQRTCPLTGVMVFPIELESTCSWVHVECVQGRTAVLVLSLQLADVSAIWQRDVPVNHHDRDSDSYWVAERLGDVLLHYAAVM